MFLGKNISTDGQNKARKQTNANRLSKQTENKQKKVKVVGETNSQKNANRF